MYHPNMKMRLLKWLTAAILLVSISSSVLSQGSQTRSLNSFDKIKIANGIEATLIKGDKNEITLTSEDIPLEDIISKVRGGELTVKLKVKLNLWKEKRIDVLAVITYTDDLIGIYANSGGYIEADHSVTTATLDINASSGAHIDIDIVCDDVIVNTNTGAEIELQGVVGRLDLRFNTGATFEGSQLEAGKAKVKGGTGGDASIKVSHYLKTNVNTGASLTYYGSPPKTDINKGTGGEVRQRS